MNEYQNILANIKRYVALTPADENQFSSIVTTTTVRRKQFIVQPRFVCAHQTYVMKGALRSYFVNPEGIEHTIQFTLKNLPFASLWEKLHWPRLVPSWTVLGPIWKPIVKWQKTPFIIKQLQYG